MTETTFISYALEVKTDDTGDWSSNQLRFPTSEQAEAYAHNLISRWENIHSWRVVDTEDIVNATFSGGRVNRLDHLHN